jgi:hypothetical protein
VAEVRSADFVLFEVCGFLARHLRKAAKTAGLHYQLFETGGRYDQTRFGHGRCLMRLNQMNSAPLETGKATQYGSATIERQDTSKVAGPLELAPGYRLEAKGRKEAEDDRLALLERIFDPLSRRRREMVQPGWRCLEVGAGRGSMAVWLAERVGDNGHVVATDMDLTYLKRFNVPNLEVRQHNILEDPLDALGPSLSICRPSSAQVNTRSSQSAHVPPESTLLRLHRNRPNLSAWLRHQDITQTLQLLYSFIATCCV